MEINYQQGYDCMTCIVYIQDKGKYFDMRPLVRGGTVEAFAILYQ